MIWICIGIGALALGYSGYRSEQKKWNSGVSAESGHPWRHFDTDSQGGRLYTDDNGNYCSVSYPFIDRIRED